MFALGNIFLAKMDKAFQKKAGTVSMVLKIILRYLHKIVQQLYMSTATSANCQTQIVITE